MVEWIPLLSSGAIPAPRCCCCCCRRRPRIPLPHNILSQCLPIFAYCDWSSSPSSIDFSYFSVCCLFRFGPTASSASLEGADGSARNDWKIGGLAAKCPRLRGRCSGLRIANMIDIPPWDSLARLTSTPSSSVSGVTAVFSFQASTSRAPSNLGQQSPSHSNCGHQRRRESSTFKTAALP